MQLMCAGPFTHALVLRTLLSRPPCSPPCPPPCPCPAHLSPPCRPPRSPACRFPCTCPGLRQELERELKLAKAGKAGKDGKVWKEESLANKLGKKREQLERTRIQAKVGGAGPPARPSLPPSLPHPLCLLRLPARPQKGAPPGAWCTRSGRTCLPACLPACHCI